jgi:hypothetical protein
LRPSIEADAGAQRIRLKWHGRGGLRIGLGRCDRRAEQGRKNIHFGRLRQFKRDLEQRMEMIFAAASADLFCVFDHARRNINPVLTSGSSEGDISFLF